MTVLIVNPNHGNTINNFPWGALIIGSYLSLIKGQKVNLIDASIIGEQEALREISRLLPKASLVGLACMSMDVPFVKAAADLVKSEKPSCKVVVGGPHPVLCPEQTAKYSNFDYVVYGPGEKTVSLLLDELSSPRPDVSRVPGLIYRDGLELRRTKPSGDAPHFDMDYSLLHERVRATLKDYAQVLTGRGCSFRCTFCYNSISGQPWRGRQMTEMMAEIKALVLAYDPKVIYFRDENFFHDRGRIYEFIDLYKSMGFRFQWRATCRANYFNEKFINQDLLKELADIGCNCLKFGFESGSEAMLKKLKKGIRVKHIRNVVNSFVNEPRIELISSFMMGLPGETNADVRDTLQLCNWIAEMVQNSLIVGPQYFRMYPGGELYDDILRDYGFRAPSTFEEWVERYRLPGNINDEGVHYPWVPIRRRYLAQHSNFLLLLARQQLPKGIGPRKRQLLKPFQLLARLRIRKGWLFWLLDLRLAKFIYYSRIRSKIRRILEKLPFYGWLRSSGLGHARPVGFLLRLVTGDEAADQQEIDNKRLLNDD